MRVLAIAPLPFVLLLLGAITATDRAWAAPTLAAPRVETDGWRPRDAPYPGRITIDVDATDVERGIFRVRESVPVRHAGRFTLLFPKWVPGNHAPTARIERLAGPIIVAGGKRLNWARDSVDMHAFHVDVPAEVRTLEIEFQFLTATDSDQGRVVMTPEMLNLQWFSLVLYPAGYYSRQITFVPSVNLPEGWKPTTQLDVASARGTTVRFRPVTLERLIDSPLFAGRNFRRFDLGAIEGAPVVLDVVADAPENLEAGDEVIEAHRRLVAEAGTLFGPAPFSRYTFMLALTREMGGIGTEHLGSSENTRPLDYFTDWRQNALLPHEFVHAWNGKARRPADLWTPDFNMPMRNSMLWVYEGQAQFWGFVLAARSGLMTDDQVMDVFARLAAERMQQPGRSWRPLADTGADAIMTRELTEEPWPSWHRSLRDSYSEAGLIWLEADGLIRELSGETRSLDDFARGFFAGGGERPSLYDLDDVVAGLEKVQSYDWAGFLDTRLNGVASAVPTAWLRRSGYRLIFTETPSGSFLEHERAAGRIDLRHSIGLILRPGPSGEVSEVIWNSPAFDAGLVAGARILSVDGSPYQPERLLKAIQGNRDGHAPITLGVETRNRQRTVVLDYRGGLRFPRLERLEGTPDRLRYLLKPRAGPLPSAGAVAMPSRSTVEGQPR